MISNGAFGRQLRLRRLYRNDSERLLIVPLDHSVSQGPITGGEGIDALVGQLATNRVDAIVLHKGSLRHVDPAWFGSTALIVHLSASTVHAPDPDAKYLVAGVEESLRLGADAVSVHVNLGSEGEQRQISDLAAVADACDRWNVPLLAMMYPRGPKISDPRDPALVAHAVSLAADLGADLVKTMYVGSVAEMKEITARAPIPVITVGGPRNDDEGQVLAYVTEALSAGVAGVAMGRNVFEAPDPGVMAAKLANLIHSE
ncbi:2-amino-4,5-dihydroxy-6-one-heptanoic acid-7-phosphate synthase [Streptomyces lunaelactis]|uniref:bagremycin/ferroverdin biosynthesis DhnA-type aldolase BagB/FevI n=1 Tax=Streptomyces lunaelactis TaxID=1535768 RepID=UPI001585C409|nr:bagremycin/ferroverdin biosynthesis DhnA-type aldolase BagB/FevI [Streptomyces lunaelactis]NUK02304.1 2-amino-4,5-dihydroxy-6-one-heptanoic acid-7-phosphate synthase [Streptomyces lunaelactis]NUK18269.1 2-amino-4,5-dihydroxy-6-one-heptanoic acid-7-phosphate synthase [Streptomyces lunaelactis]NUK25031.1 2-amino-4,5-dihydroxy-6-one-heptanoic acid-7-phosphate synthase [Streptomyces lunaelactis]NUK50852.1 2-amino-4,5-dihydroxy-6-one-heptanoic acid-7-phosphate synthase [Streptomyces lunaelactis]